MKISLSLGSIALALLAGCAPTLQRQVEDVKATARPALNQLPAALPTSNAKGSAAQAEQLARAQVNPAVSRRASKPWFGARLVAVQSDEQLPPIFYERFSFNFNDPTGRVPLGVVAERIYQHTNVPVRVSADVYATPAASGGGDVAPIQAMVMPVPGSSANRPGAVPLPPLPPAGVSNGVAEPTPKHSMAPARTRQPIIDLDGVDMVWKDRSMVAFLDMLTDRLGLSWSYRDGVVTIHRYLTESFELAAFSTAQDYSMSLSGASQGTAGATGGGAGGSSASSLQVNETGRVNAVQSLVQAVTKMLGGVPGSSVTLSEGTARLTVTSTKDGMREVRRLIRAEQEALTRQVMLQIDIYSMSQTTANEAGLNLQVLFRNLENTFGASLVSPSSAVSNQAGAIAVNILSLANGGNPESSKARKWGDSGAIIQALHQNGVMVQHQPLTMIAMNRQWARKTNLRQTGYLSETVPSTVAGAGSGAPGLKTSTVITGDRFLVQPAILDNGAVMLKFGVSLTNLLGLFDVSTGTGATLQRVQTPEVSGTDDQSTVMLRAGEVMVLTGMSRYKANADGRKLSENVSVLLGGSQKAENMREEFIVFVRPVIL